MGDKIQVRDIWNNTILIYLDKIACVSFSSSYKIDGVSYPCTAIYLTCAEGSEELSSSAFEIIVTGEQALRLRDFFKVDPCCDFSTIPTAEDVHIKPERKPSDNLPF